jgi:DNA-binding protein YbaB
MFDKLKQIGQIKKMQEKMKEERIEANEKGVKIIINGNFEVEKIVLNQGLNSEEQAIILKRLFNQAVKDIQVKIAQNFSGLI